MQCCSRLNKVDLLLAWICSVHAVHLLLNIIVVEIVAYYLVGAKGTMMW